MGKEFNAKKTKHSDLLVELECLYDCAKIEADWVKDRVITYAEEHEHNEAIKPYYEHIKQALTTKSKKEQAFDIVKEKGVDIDVFQSCKTLNEYNYSVVYIVGEPRELTQAEYDLLKEML
jgi:hypothetical protein